MKPEPMQHANALPNSQSPLLKWLDQYGNGATVVACVAMIGGAIWYSMNRTATGRNEIAWAKYSQARSAKDFGEIADDYSNTDVGAWARLGEAERLTESGISLMFTDRKGALGELKNADEAFQKVLAKKSAASAVRERATWGLAKSTEAQCDGDTSQSIEAYQTLLKEFPNSIYKAAAQERIESLKTESAKEFYAWFHKQNPKLADTKKPMDGLPDGHPPLDLPLDDTPEVEKPKSKEQTKAADPAGSVMAKLKTEVEVEFARTPLQEAFKLIAEKCEVAIEIDGDALKAAGFTKNMPQTQSLGKVTGLDAIAAVLKKYEKEKVPLVLVIQEDEKKALITTSEFAKKNELTPFEFAELAGPPKIEESKTKEPKTEESKDEKSKDEKSKDEKPKDDEPKDEKPKPE
ncbi:MAG: tetratricopeptide repeat protein [Planctomycetaceae bacterium]